MFTFVPGFTSQLTVVYNRNRENENFHYDKNGFQVRPALFGRETPRHYYVVYWGYNGDGHFGRANLTTSVYYAFGKDRTAAAVMKAGVGSSLSPNQNASTSLRPRPAFATSRIFEPGKSRIAGRMHFFRLGVGRRA